jgi:hypothetical protein
MVINTPFKVVVCLAILGIVAAAGMCWGYNGTQVSPSRGVEADALSAEPRIRAVPPAKPQSSRSSQPRYRSSGNPTPANPSFPRYAPPNNQSFCPPGQPFGCAPPQPFGYGPRESVGYASLLPPIGQLPFAGLFSLRPFGFTRATCFSLMPHPRCKQFVLTASLWYAKMDSNTTLWGTNLAGGPGTEIDMHSQFEFDKRHYIPEWEARCQIRKNWGIRYSFMPVEYYKTATLDPGRTFWFGNWLFLSGTRIHSKWHRYFHRWDLVYDWFNQPYAVSSIFAGFSLVDDMLSVSQQNILRKRSRFLHLAFAGMSLNRVVRDVGGGGWASIHCKGAVQFMEGYVGWDAKTTARLAVPLNCGRFGYFEAGWRWMGLNFDRPTDIDKTNLDGLFGSFGLIF